MSEETISPPIEQRALQPLKAGNTNLKRKFRPRPSDTMQPEGMRSNWVNPADTTTPRTLEALWVRFPRSKTCQGTSLLRRSSLTLWACVHMSCSKLLSVLRISLRWRSDCFSRLALLAISSIRRKPSCADNFSFLKSSECSCAIARSFANHCCFASYHLNQAFALSGKPRLEQPRARWKRGGKTTLHHTLSKLCALSFRKGEIGAVGQSHVEQTDHRPDLSPGLQSGDLQQGVHVDTLGLPKPNVLETRPTLWPKLMFLVRMLGAEAAFPRIPPLCTVLGIPSRGHVLSPLHSARH